MREHRPTKVDLAGAYGRRVPDLVAPNLSVLFCGINPSLYSAATGHHFARPGNRFWAALHGAGFTDRLLKPWDEELLLDFGLGITNLVSRATTAASEISAGELRRGRQSLTRKVRRYRPRCVAVLGIGAYRLAFDPHAVPGRQSELLETATLWVLPNPSGLNANYQRADFVQAFEAVQEFLATADTGGSGSS